MKRFTFLFVGVLFTLTSFGQSNIETNRPERGDFLAGIMLNPNFLTNNSIFFPTPSGQVLIQGLNLRYYSSARHAHQVQLNFNGASSNYGQRNFNNDDNYTYELSQTNSFVSAGYGYLWVTNFGKNWQVVYGPGAKFEMSSTRTNYDYSHTAQELSDAGQSGNYYEDQVTQNYTMGAGFGAEINYFISERVFVGLSTSVGVQTTIIPSRTYKYTQVYPGFLQEVENESPGTSTTTFTSQQPIFLTLGVVF
ncbi:MAG: hypothetical protein HWD92_00945 [Flavobacteriia bacterium]|nr:hypothetical protein [Flavobacteriia bacterium]